MTYSIVARDAETGEIGAAVQSHYFGAGSVVLWAEAGVGAVATQSIVELSYGPLGLDRMRDGDSAGAALDPLVAADPMSVVRQVAMVDAGGQVAVHTGPACVGRAGHVVGDAVSTQANMMERDTVWGAMHDAYESAAGEPLPDRLLAALDAAEAEGGDIRGRQSAALLVVSGERSAAPWDGRLVDLRVDDHPDPLVELRRLLETKGAVDHLAKVFGGGLLFAPAIDPDGPELRSALDSLDQAQRGLVGNHEPTFWSAVLFAKAGRIEEASERLAIASGSNARWPAFLPRLVDAGVLAPDSEILDGSGGA